MKLFEVFKKSNQNPQVFVDMDGVLADLFNYAAELHDVKHYNSMSKEQFEKFFANTDSYKLFRDLPKFKSTDALLNLVLKYAGKFNILSSPNIYNTKDSIKGKREWLENNVNVPINKIIFDHEKYKYATQKNGTPNILIDDFSNNTRLWKKQGGIAIKYQADEDSLEKVEDLLKKIY